MNDVEERLEEPLDALAAVSSHPNLESAGEHALVILATREACWITEDEEAGGYLLKVEPHCLETCLREISAYEAEKPASSGASIQRQESFHFPVGWLAMASWMLALTLSFIAQNHVPGIVSIGASSSIGFIGHHEWWRPFTSLFLHADTSHLAGNLLSGAFFGGLVARSMGARTGWCMILACGTLGNIITSSLTYPEAFTSIGASTAVFAALGILSGLGFASLRRQRMNLSLMRTAAPVLAGIIVLGLLGGGAPDGNTDVPGHVCGFLSGLACGILKGIFSRATGDASSAGISMEGHDARI